MSDCTCDAWSIQWKFVPNDPLNEKLLHYIWQHRHFDPGSLMTSDGRRLDIVCVGSPHIDQGPDFRDARICISDTLWIGHVELHVRTSDWFRHRHDGDANYGNVVLHVVWEHDGCEQVGLPVLELRERVPLETIRRLVHWMQGHAQVSCEREMHAHGIGPSTEFLEKLVLERLHRKSERILSSLVEAKGHWEEVFWWQTARNFGYRVNADAFEEMARSVKVRILQQNKHSIHMLEAILMGQCNLLRLDAQDDYARMLAAEYNFARRKYGLQPIRMPVFFLRMRPHNFPTVRLAQLAMLVRESSRLFSRFRHADGKEEVRRLLTVTANDYWHYRYGFDRPSIYQPKTLGKSMADNILANTVVPFLYSYSIHNGEHYFKERALQWLRDMDAERNRSTDVFQRTGGRPENALESQGMLELRTQYCERRRCLECDVCAQLLSRMQVL